MRREIDGTIIYSYTRYHSTWCDWKKVARITVCLFFLLSVCVHLLYFVVKPHHGQ